MISVVGLYAPQNVDNTEVLVHTKTTHYCFLNDFALVKDTKETYKNMLLYGWTKVGPNVLATWK